MKTITMLIIVAACLMAGCHPDERDLEPPSILENGIATCPVECEQFCLDDTIRFCYIFSDNQELGNYNIEIHNNFDHHTHSTSSVECDLDVDKEPINAWIFNQDYAIPPGSRNYMAQFAIPIPDDVDVGDYHFMIRLTDCSGWQQLRFVAIKLIPAVSSE